LATFQLTLPITAGLLLLLIFHKVV